MKWAGALPLLGLACAPAAPEAPSFRSTPAADYVPEALPGWDLRVAKDLLNAAPGRRAQDLLQEKLAAIEAVVPEPALSALRGVPIWISAEDTPCPAICYHLSSDWLRANGYDPAKAGGVEIANAGRFVEWAPTQPWFVLHELAHAYHQQVRGLGDRAILESFQSAKASGLLDQVPYIKGGQRRHYGLTDEREFFAEMSESFFGENDFFPFDRPQLHQLLPGVEAVLAEAWRAP
ncbi:MAG: hypothetical protein U1E65_03265 [Myxococcota bacterium]